MTYDEIFEAYYNLYRVENTIPTSEEDEYAIGLRLANEAINRWAMYDGTYWKELFTNLTLAGETQVITAGTVDYDCPDDFKEAGGYVMLRDPVTLDVVERYPIYEPQEVQFKGDNARYCYFTGNPSEGYTMRLNPGVDSASVGRIIDYVYYKKPTLMTTGDDTTEMSEPYFMVHRMLANRFRGSRNPYYAAAKGDAEDALKIMKMTNDSGSWANPWKLQDNSGTLWGN